MIPVSRFFREHLLGMLLFAIATGLVTSYIYDNLKSSSATNQVPQVGSTDIAATTEPTSSPVIAFTRLAIDQQDRGIDFQREKAISYFGKVLFPLGSFDPMATELRVSTPTPKRGLVYILLVDLDRGGWDSAIVSEREHEILVRDIGKARRLQLLDAIYWSPTEKFAVIPPSGEVRDTVAVVNVETRESNLVHMGTFSRNQCEIASPRFDLAQWESEFVLRVAIQFERNRWETECGKYVLNQKPVFLRLNIRSHSITID